MFESIATAGRRQLELSWSNGWLTDKGRPEPTAERHEHVAERERLLCSNMKIRTIYANSARTSCIQTERHRILGILHGLLFEGRQRYDGRRDKKCTTTEVDG